MKKSDLDFDKWISAVNPKWTNEQMDVSRISWKVAYHCHDSEIEGLKAKLTEMEETLKQIQKCHLPHFEIYSCTCGFALEKAIKGGAQ